MQTPRIFNYELKGLIGEGAFGRVFEAEHVILGRKTALKQLKPIGSEEEQSKRRDLFVREARILAKNDDEHIVRIYDFLAVQDAGYWIAMEFVEGCNTHEWLKSPAWSLSDATEIFSRWLTVWILSIRRVLSTET